MSLQQFIAYRKTGGWLRVFQVLTIISLVVSSLSLILVLLGSQLTIQIGSLTPAYLIYTVITEIIVVGLEVLQLVMLAKRNKNLSHAHLITSLLGFVTTGVALLIPSFDLERLTNYATANGLDPAATVASVSASKNFGITIFSTIISIALLVAWTIYFHRSERYRVYNLNTAEYNQEYAQRRQQWEQQQAGQTEYNNGATAPVAQPVQQPAQQPVSAPAPQPASEAPAAGAQAPAQQPPQNNEPPQPEA